jgi:hypothetical protein
MSAPHFWRPAPLGFSAASAIVALSQFILDRRPFGLVALGFAWAALRRWYVRRDRNAFSSWRVKSLAVQRNICLSKGQVCGGF